MRVALGIALSLALCCACLPPGAGATGPTNTTTGENAMQEIINKQFDNDAFLKEINRIHTIIQPYIEKDPTAFFTLEEAEKRISGNEEAFTAQSRQRPFPAERQTVPRYK